MQNELFFLFFPFLSLTREKLSRKLWKKLRWDLENHRLSSTYRQKEGHYSSQLEARRRSHRCSKCKQCNFHFCLLCENSSFVKQSLHSRLQKETAKQLFGDFKQLKPYLRLVKAEQVKWTSTCWTIVHITTVKFSFANHLVLFLKSREIAIYRWPHCCNLRVCKGEQEMAIQRPRTKKMFDGEMASLSAFNV